MVACWSSLQAATSVGGPMLPVQCHEPQSGSVHNRKLGSAQVGRTPKLAKLSPLRRLAVTSSPGQ